MTPSELTWRSGGVVTDLVYLDTSALMRWATGICGSPDERDERGKQALEALVAGSQQLGGSPITIAEFTSVLHDHVRSDKEWASYFEAEDATSCMQQFMMWLADGTIAIRPLGRTAFEVGMAYVEMVSARGRKMRCWDAIHLFEACRWARDAGTMVTIATSDGDFAKVITLFPEFSTYVDVLDVCA
jgi:hypothetical protein